MAGGGDLNRRKGVETEHVSMFLKQEQMSPCQKYFLLIIICSQRCKISIFFPSVRGVRELIACDWEVLNDSCLGGKSSLGCFDSLSSF